MDRIRNVPSSAASPTRSSSRSTRARRSTTSRSTRSTSSPSGRTGWASSTTSTTTARWSTWIAPRGSPAPSCATRPGVFADRLIGSGRIAARFIEEARYVSGVTWRRCSAARRARRRFAERSNFRVVERLLEDLLGAGRRGLCRLAARGARRTGARGDRGRRACALREADDTDPGASRPSSSPLANERSVTLVEAVKTAFSPGFQRMVAVARSGSIGRITLGRRHLHQAGRNGSRTARRRRGQSSPSSPPTPCWPREAARHRLHRR